MLKLLCGNSSFVVSLRGERRLRDRGSEGEEKKNHLTINKQYGKCIKWYHWREGLREREG